MKLTDILLIFLIGLIGFQKFPLKQLKTVSKKETKIITVGKETKTVKAVNQDQVNSKHSTTFRNYIDSDGRSNQRISHNIRVGKEYYISGGISTRQSSYGSDSVGADISITKYW